MITRLPSREYNIKEPGFKAVYKGIPPFMKYESGFGYIGVLLESEETGELQCHICGETNNSLAKHIYHKHKDINTSKYKEMVGLNMGTPLMSESTRKKIKNNFLNLTDEKRQEVINRMRNFNKSNHSKKLVKPRTDKGGSAEMQNKFGTCPEQARTLFWEEYTKFGRIPTTDEMSCKLKNLVYTRFGSYKEAMIAWGVSEQEYRAHFTEADIKAYEARRQANFFPKYSKEEVIQRYSDFYFEKKRLPTWGEVKQFGMPGRIPFTRAFGKSKSEVENMFTMKDREY